MNHNIVRKKGKEGIATMWAGLILLVLVMFIALVVDTGYMVLTRQQLQTVADAASLAGVYTVRTDQDAARTNAVAIGLMNSASAVNIILEANLANAEDGDIVIGRFDLDTNTFSATIDYPNAVQVHAARASGSMNTPITFIFGDLLGTDTVNIDATSVAMVQGGLGAGVIALNETEPCSLDIRGTPSDFHVNNGIIYVNSNNIEAMCHAGQPTVDTAEIYVVGGTDKHYEQVDVTGEVIFTDDIIPDPLAELPAPFYDVDADPAEIFTTGSGDNKTYGPGYYSLGLTLNTGTLNLTPGVYILDGAGLNITGGDFYAEGCTFYIIDSTPGDNQESNVNITGNGILQMSAPDVDEYTYTESPDITPYADAGVTIFQARGNTNDSTILGTVDASISGTIYMPDNHVQFGGTSTNLANGLIADTIEIFGNGIMSINYDGRYGVLPPKVFLVQ